MQINWLGKAPRGYPIEETTITTEAGNKTTSKVELIEISEAPLDTSLFNLPAGYRRALQTGNGGADLTKADTVSKHIRNTGTVGASSGVELTASTFHCCPLGQ